MRRQFPLPSRALPSASCYGENNDYHLRPVVYATCLTITHEDFVTLRVPIFFFLWLL